MTRLRPLLAGLVCLAAFTGCASTPEGDPAQLRDHPESLTGSNIPRRDGSRVGVTTVDPQAVQELMNSLSKSGPPKP